MVATVLSIDTIVSNPEIRGGRPIIAGTRIRVMDLVASHLYRNFEPGELAVQFNLSIAQVYAALAYYYLHKEEIDADLHHSIQQGHQLIEELARQGKVTFLE